MNRKWNKSGWIWSEKCVEKDLESITFSQQVYKVLWFFYLKELTSTNKLNCWDINILPRSLHRGVQYIDTDFSLFETLTTLLIFRTIVLTMCSSTRFVGFVKATVENKSLRAVFSLWQFQIYKYSHKSLTMNISF